MNTRHKRNSNGAGAAPGALRPRPGFGIVMALLAMSTVARAAAPRPFVQRIVMPPVRVEPVAGLTSHIHGGKLYLHLDEFLQLVLENDAGIQLVRLTTDTANDAVLNARAPFDPQFTANFNTLRSISPQYTQTSGASTLNSLGQTTQAGYTQLLASGQRVSIGFSAVRSSSNNRFAYFNPSIQTGMNFSITQPLLRDRGNISYLAPLQIARTQLMITSETSEAQIADNLVQAANQYWNAVQARDNIQVQQQALDLAQKSYDRDRHALQLGALPKLDIYQSEAQVARNRLALIQAQYTYREQVDALRQYIGADLHARTRTMEIVLEDSPSAENAVVPDVPVGQAIQEALRNRPELDSVQRSLYIDQLNARLARNSMRPRLDLTGQYSSAGQGGDQIPVTGPLGTGPSAFVPGGLGDALGQMFGFSAPSYGFGLQLTFPLRNSSAEAHLADALVARAHDRYSMRQARQQIIQQVLYADNQLQMSRAQITAARTARDLARKNVAAEEEKYKLGSTTIFEVLQAQVQLSQDETSLVAANIGFQKALIAWRRATWTLFGAMGVQLDPMGAAAGGGRSRR